jgi:predicted 2-oxoglutarate/Fe(II)-dependent dioxygenase YbiX
MAAPFTYANRLFTLEAGQLVLFPSWVLHEVKVFHGEGERITVAFNCGFSVANATA